jgi:hypothetical protein
MSSRSAEGYYSDKGKESGKNIEEIDDDLEAELQAAIDACPEIETTESLMAALDDADENAIEIAADAVVAPAADDWLADVQALARKHRPFSAAQIAQIVRELEAPIDGPVR